MASSKPVDIGKAGLEGWRVKVADTVADPVSSRTSLTDDHVRAALGALFFVLSVKYVVSTVKRIADSARA